MQSVLFVCTASICRSPTAAGVLRRLLAGAADVEIVAAATHDYRVGEPPLPLAVTVAGRRGYDLDGHASRRVTPGDFDRFDHIIAMDRTNLASLRSIAPSRTRDKIELLLDYGEKYRGMEVPDPYGGDEAAYARTLEMIEDGCRGLARALRVSPSGR